MSRNYYQLLNQLSIHQICYQKRPLLALSSLITFKGKKFFLEKLFTLFTRGFYCLISLCYLVNTQ